MKTFNDFVKNRSCINCI